MDHQWELRDGEPHPTRADLMLFLADGTTLAVQCCKLATHHVGAMPPRWSDATPEERAYAEANASSIELCAEFTVHGETAIGFYDVTTSQGCRRYGLAPTEV